MSLHIWPGVPLPIPQYRPTTMCLLNESRDALFFTRDRVPFVGDATEVTVESHGEIYLRLYELDLDDPDAIAAFARQYSVLDGDAMHKHLKREHCGGFSSFGRCPQFSFPAARRETYERAQSEQVSRDDLPLKTEIETLIEFRMAALALREITARWLSSSSGPATATPERWPGRDLPYALISGRFSLQKVLPALLRNHTPYIGREPRTRHAPLYEVCAFELFNHITESPTYHHCENCGRLFVRQYGRAEHGQSRTQGVSYCSVHCGQAAASRAYRRRRSAKLAAQNQAATDASTASPVRPDPARRTHPDGVLEAQGKGQPSVARTSRKRSGSVTVEPL